MQSRLLYGTEFTHDLSLKILIITKQNHTLLSHKYSDVLIGLKGSKSMFTFFSLPSSVTIVPQYMTKPLGGTGKSKELLNYQRTKHKYTYLWHTVLISVGLM